MAGSGEPVAGPGAWNQAPGSVGADRGGTAIGTVQYRRGPEPASQPVRLAPRPMFLVGREQLLADVHARLTNGRTVPGPRLLALCGLGGAGKTSMAVEYAHRHLAEVAVCWQLSAEDPAVLLSEFAVLAAQLGARDLVDSRDPVATVHAVLARLQSAWLLIFDNVADQASIEPFIPPAGPGRVLITTQSQHWPSGQALHIPMLGAGASADFLVSRTGDTDRATALALATELGGLPLALEQAAAYMQATGTAMARYLPIFQTRQASLLAHGQPAGHPVDVAATLDLALSRLAEWDRSAASLMNVLAFLAPNPVPLIRMLTPDQPVNLPNLQIAEALGPLLDDPVTIGAAIIALRRYSLVAPAGDGMFFVHRLVQALTRNRLTAGQAAQWRRASVDLVKRMVPARPDSPAAWPIATPLLPHALAVLDLTSGDLWMIAAALGHSGNCAAARDLFRLITEAYTNDVAYGPEHSNTLAARGNLARWTGEAGDAGGARDQLAALLPVEERVLNREHPNNPITRLNLARWTGEAGDAGGARDQLAALLPVAERVVGREHPTTLAIRGDLARWTGESDAEDMQSGS